MEAVLLSAHRGKWFVTLAGFGTDPASCRETAWQAQTHGRSFLLIRVTSSTVPSEPQDVPCRFPNHHVVSIPQHEPPFLVSNT